MDIDKIEQTPDEFIDNTLIRFGIPKHSFLGYDRRPEILSIRKHIAKTLYATPYDLHYTTIGRLINRNHATVMNLVTGYRTKKKLPVDKSVDN